MTAPTKQPTFRVGYANEIVFSQRARPVGTEIGKLPPLQQKELMSLQTIDWVVQQYLWLGIPDRLKKQSLPQLAHHLALVEGAVALLTCSRHERAYQDRMHQLRWIHGAVLRAMRGPYALAQAYLSGCIPLQWKEDDPFLQWMIGRLTDQMTPYFDRPMCEAAQKHDLQFLHACITRRPLSWRNAERMAALIETRDRWGETALMGAASKSLPLLRLILATRPDPDATDDRRQTALCRVARYRELPILQALVQAGASVNLASDTGTTPLQEAIIGDTDIATIQFLLDARADVNAKDQSQFTPLMIACLFKRETMVEPLLAARSDVHARDDADQSLLHRAAYNGWDRLVDQLLSRPDIDVNTRCRFGTALTLAAGAMEAGPGHEAVVKLLLDRRADPWAQDNKGRSALTRARGAGNRAIFDLILQAYGRS